MGKKSSYKRLIENAVYYLHCVESGFIRDPEPKKTIAFSYGVNISAVQKWSEDPVFYYVRTQKKEESFDPYSVRSLLEIHGEMYRKHFSSSKEAN